MPGITAPSGQTTVAGTSTSLPLCPKTASDDASAKQPSSRSQDFDVVKTYHQILASDPEMSMPVAAIETLIEAIAAHPSTTAMGTVEVVQREKAKLVDSTPNPLPLLAGADLFEQYLQRSLRGETSSSADFSTILQHLLDNRQLFADRARAARDRIADYGVRYVADRHVVLVAGGSRTVTKILLRALADPTKHFRIVYVVDGSAPTLRAVQTLREAGAEVETIGTHKVAHVLSNCRLINLVLVGTEVVMQNGGIVSTMGTSQLAELTKAIPGSAKRFMVAAETHKICRRTPMMGPILHHIGVRQKGVSKWQDVGRELDEDEVAGLLPESAEVDYTKPDLIDGFITETGIRQPGQIWEMVDDYI